MSMPNIPDINANISITRENAINIIIASIAMEELSIAHILNAEGEKLQYVLGTLKDQDPVEVTICDIMAVNESIRKTLRNVINAEMLLEYKLEDAIEMDEGGDVCRLTVSGRKIWRDGNNVAGRPSSVNISLLRDGAVVDTATANAANNWTYSFRCLPLWSATGDRYTYTVDEPAPPAGYTKTVEGYNVINTAVTTINGTKTWVNTPAGEEHDEITVNLLQNGVKIDSKTVTTPDGADTAQFSFVNVPLYDSEGKQYTYLLSEEPIDDYTSNIVGNDITNTYIP